MQKNLQKAYFLPKVENRLGSGVLIPAIKENKYSDEEVPIDALEKVIRIMTRKYLIRIRSISPDIWSNKDSDIWRCEVVNDKTLELIKNVYGISLYEVLAKTAILMYSEIKKERLKVRE